MTYDSAAALRQALEDRLAVIARERRVDLARLRRRVAFERILARLYQTSHRRWVLKGGMALEFRMGDKARTTRDLDLAVRDPDTVEAVRDTLVRELSIDLDDGFEFRVLSTKELSPDEAGRPGWRFTLDARMAGRTFAEVRVDVVARTDEIVGTEEIVIPSLLAFASQPEIRVESVDRRQHFAEKVHAYTRSYRERPSSRVHDLADLIGFVGGGLEPDQRLAATVGHVFRTRNTHPIPDRAPTSTRRLAGGVCATRRGTRSFASHP